MCASHVKEVQAQYSNPLNFILHPIRLKLILASVTAAVGSMLTLVPLIAITWVISTIFTEVTTLGGSQQGDDKILWMMLLSIGCLLLGMLLLAVSELIAHLADHEITGQLQSNITQHLTQVPLGWFTGRSSGEVKQIMQDDIGLLHSLTAHFYPAVGRAFGTISVALIFLLMMDWRMAILALLPFLGFVIFLRKAMRASGNNIQQFANQLGQINSAAVEFIHAIPVVKTFGKSGQASQSYQQAVHSFADAFRIFTRPLVKSMAHAHAMISPITILGVVLLSGTLLISLGWLKPINLLPFMLVTPTICAPVLLLHTLLHDLQASQAAAQRILALLDTPVLPMAKGNPQLQIKDSSIDFHQVSYGYAAQHQVLSDLNFSLKSGTITAIVGPSGAGKSTIAQLLLRFFDPVAGKIMLGGVDLRDIQTTTLYQQIGFVLQDTRLIHASVRDNIALGRPNANQQEIENAAKAANIHDRIMALPQGYQSIVGKDAQLSGGERQRISIARAILLDPPILVLDEATAAADIENEIAIQDALSKFAQGRTLLVIAHRLDTIMNADQILVLDQGKIVEQGTHEVLFAQQGLYHQLWSYTEKHVHTQMGEASC
ncbi:ABC transporter ATP-binding protein [Acinetobacter guillouiae]|uniref:ABC transporter ATP-binding protein n=1 Tax=Acinetobacter guillouiae TaxID=106649 RepID=UPI001CD2EAD1|nr:ABC transporter ATP-binding protein [Acinetobacter guillouiae]